MAKHDESFADYRAALGRLRAAARLRALTSCRADGAYLWHDGCRLLNLSGNDYLGLATDASVQAEAEREAAGLPLTASSSRLLTGNCAEADALEQDLARVYQRPSVLFNSGYHANLGLIPALFGKETLILADKLVHASIIDGIRLSAARHLRYRHNDLTHLRRLLTQHAAAYRRVAVVTESVFGMDGDCADLPALVALKQEFPYLMLYVDEAHAFGVYGQDGLGLAQETGTLGDIDVLTATFGKAAASYGAFAVLAPPLRDYVINSARTLIFSTALPAAQLAVSRVLLHHLVHARPQRAHLHRLGARCRQRLGAGAGAPHIVPLMMGTDGQAVAATTRLRASGFHALPIRPPTVPAGTARIRLSLTAALTDQDIDTLAQAVRRL